MVSAACYLILWGYLTSGWSHKLWNHGKIAMIFAFICLVQVAIIHSQHEKISELRLQASPEYARLLKTREDNCEEIEQENIKLKRQLGTMQGQCDISDVYLQKFLSKPTISDGRGVDEANGRLCSLDGRSRSEKDQIAYKLSLEGWTNEEIADELGLSTGGIKSYISRGKKYFQKHPIDAEEDGGEIHLKYADGKQGA